MISNEKQIESTMQLMTACCEAVDNVPWGTEVEFTCPICGGRATGSRAEYNGHHWCGCKTCDTTIME